MYKINEDLSIYVTRGDSVLLDVRAETKDGEPYTFMPGELVRFKVSKKKNCAEVVLEKDFPITAATQTVQIFLEKEETKLGGVISKPVDYWYEVELNPLEECQTIIGYDEDGAKVFKLFPEGADKELEEYVPEDEEGILKFTDDELDLTSRRPVENRVIARAIIRINSMLERLPEYITTVTPETFGAMGDGENDDSVAINEAISYLKRAGGGTLKLSQGKTYALGYVDEYGAIVNCASNITIDGNGATLKVSDNLGDYDIVFKFDGCENLIFKDFVLDENTKGNPKTALTGHSRTRVAFSAWHSDTKNILLENVSINDCIGTWQVTIGDGEKRVKDITLKNCKVNYNTEALNLDYDRTTFYLGGENILVEGCVLNGGADIINAHTGIEFHGDNIRAVNNKVIHYNHGFFVCNDTECAVKNDNLVIDNNYIDTKIGILLWFSFSNRDVNNVSIKNNCIAFDTVGIGSYDRHGAGCVFKNINIKNNTLSSENTNSLPFSFKEFSHDELNSFYKNVNIVGNSVSVDSVYFVDLESQPENAFHFENIKVKENYFNAKTSNLFRFLQREAGDSLVFENNTFDVETANTPTVTGFDKKAVAFQDNDLGNMSVLLFVTEKPIKVIHYFDDLVFLDHKIFAELRDRFVEGSVFKSAKTQTRVVGLDVNRFITNGVVESIPPNCFIDKGSEFFVIKENAKKTVKTAGLTYDRLHASGTTNKVGEYISSGLYVYLVKKENSSSDFEDTSLFTYIGDSVQYL